MKSLITMQHISAHDISSANSFNAAYFIVQVMLSPWRMA